eukprot:Rmarinus@m.7496
MDRPIWPVFLGLVIICVLEQAIANPIDLTAEGYDTLVANIPSNAYVLVLFFAPWCPHCRKFAPTFEEVANIIDAGDTGRQITVARVDCSVETRLCADTFKVKGYPTMLVGPHSAWEKKELSEEIVKVTAERKTNKIIEWLVNELSVNLNPGYTHEAFTDAPENPGEVILPPPSTMVNSRDVEKALATSIRYILEGPPLLIDSRSALLSYLDLIRRHYPDDSCRDSVEELLILVDAEWAPESTEVSLASLMRVWAPCGREWEDYESARVIDSTGTSTGGWEWVECASQVPSARGYTCGLWELFHVLLVARDYTASSDDSSGGSSNSGGAGGNGLPEGPRPGGGTWGNSAANSVEELNIPSGMPSLLAIRGYIEHFFACEDCRTHFLCMSEPLLNDGSAYLNRYEAALWLWRIHNLVNLRTTAEDPLYPKIQWPAESVCMECHWAEEGNPRDVAVIRYLFRFYQGGFTDFDDAQVDKAAYEFLRARDLDIKGPMMAKFVDPLEGSVGAYDVFNADDATVFTPVGFLLMVLFSTFGVILLLRGQRKWVRRRLRRSKESPDRSWMV